MSRARLEVSEAAPGIFILADNDAAAEECERRLREVFQSKEERDAGPDR